MATESEVVFDLLGYVGKQMEGEVEYWDALFDRQSSCTIKDNVDERIALPEFAGIQLRSFKNGECIQALKGGMISGKAVDMIKNISGISNQQFIESGATAFSCIAPYIRFEDVQIAGK